MQGRSRATREVSLDLWLKPPKKSHGTLLLMFEDPGGCSFASVNSSAATFIPSLGFQKNLEMNSFRSGCWCYFFCWRRRC